MQKLKNRLDAFSDAIIAVVITVMVLDIPPVLKDSLTNYGVMGKHIGIYLISFIFVANMWYQHATVFDEIETMTYRILIGDFIFLACLSMMPLFTNMMTVNTTRVTVMLYGTLQFVVNMLFRILSKAIIHLKYTDKQAMQKVYTKIYGNANHILGALAVWDIVVAWFFPHVALVFYLAYPILTFFLNAQARQEMYDVEELPADEQADVATFNTSELKDFRKAQQAIMTQPPDTGKPAADRPSWLDHNVDSRKRQRLLQRYSRATPEQQAQLQRWFMQRRQNGFDPHHNQRK
ncbi:TMEM175 family protein [Lacticaseibacillus jixiensis]|uniref:TMEM175 family protein n=1 Tax=Lacticaseibacillus jixiensis TaxID=3231926 RepID=UPI0036F20B4A